MSNTAPYLGISLLVVDDDKSLRSMIARSAQSWSYEVSEAPSAEIALANLKTKQHNIVLTDIRMGKMDGLAFAEEIRSKCPYTAVLIMTGHSSTESAKRAQEMGAVYYLTKPMNMTELSDTLRIASGWSIGMMTNRAAQLYMPKYKGIELGIENKLQAIKNEIKRIVRSSASAGLLCKSVYQKDFGSTDLCRQLDIAFTIEDVRSPTAPPAARNPAMERVLRRRKAQANLRKKP